MHFKHVWRHDNDDYYLLYIYFRTFNILLLLLLLLCFCCTTEFIYLFLRLSSTIVALHQRKVRWHLVQYTRLPMQQCSIRQTPWTDEVQNYQIYQY